jgi:hypothetical protein
MGGQLSGKAFMSMLKAVAASLAAQSLVEAAMQVAHAIKQKAMAAASLAVGDVSGAALHTIAAAGHIAAAKAFGVVGGVAAVAALAMPGGGGAGGMAEGSAQGERDQNARRDSFIYNSGAVPSSQAASEGSKGGIAGMVKETLDRVSQESARREDALRASLDRVSSALSPFETASPEDVVQRGLGGASGPEIAGAAVLKHQRENQGFTQEFLTNAGFSR